MKISFFKKKDKYKKLSLRDENDFNVIAVDYTRQKVLYFVEYTRQERIAYEP